MELELFQKVLSCIDAPFINTHLGITLKYRGVHGGYWALANGDPDNYGVTVHLIDVGIDTGGVLYQKFIKVLKNDNFNTYPIHQIAHAIPLMKDTLNDIKENQLNTEKASFHQSYGLTLHYLNIFWHGFLKESFSDF